MQNNMQNNVHLSRFADDYIYPLIAGSIVHYSNKKSHPFEVQFVSYWITDSVFAESRAKVLCGLLSFAMVIMYNKRFGRELDMLDMLDISYGIDKKHPVTWMNCLNVGGSFYLSLSWLYTMVSLAYPQLRQRNYEKGIKTGAGVAYIILSLVLYKKYKR